MGWMATLIASILDIRKVAHLRHSCMENSKFLNANASYLIQYQGLLLLLPLLPLLPLLAPLRLLHMHATVGCW